MPSPTQSSPQPAKRVTAADVARSLGLSRATVGFVFNDTPGQSISDATKQRVFAEAQRLGYRPHTAARALASGRSRLVLLVLPDWPLDHAMRVHLDEAAATLDRSGYSLVTMTPHPDGQAAPLWETLNPDVVLSLTPMDDAQYAAISATGALTIIPGRDMAAVLGTDLRFADGPRVQIEHLHARGRRRIAFAGTTDSRLADLSRQRRDLAARTLDDLAGVGLAATADIDPGNAAEVVAMWRRDGIDGVAAYNDDVAALVVGSALRASVAVPETFAVVGHDDTPLASLMVPSLSSIRIDAAGLGRFLAQLALSALGEGPVPAAGPSADAVLVVRESS